MAIHLKGVSGANTPESAYFRKPRHQTDEPPIEPTYGLITSISLLLVCLLISIFPRWEDPNAGYDKDLKDF